MGEQNWTKIVIPSGTVDSSQNAIIEIPVNLKGSHIVIAKNRVSDDGESQGDEVELEVISDKEKEMIESIQNYEDERKRLVIAPVRQKYRLVDQMEYVETGVLRKDITDFQEARRKLVFDVHSIISTLPDINKAFFDYGSLTISVLSDHYIQFTSMSITKVISGSIHRTS